MKQLLLALIFTVLPLTAYSADHFYCECSAGSTQCNAGLDSNDGLTQATAKRTFRQASLDFARMPAGDSIRFCRGGSFTSITKNRWINYNCSRSNKCTVTDYGSQSLPKPFITQTVNQSLFALEDGGNADHDEGYVFSNINIKCTGCTENGTGYGFFLSNDVDYVTIENMSITGFSINIYIAGANRPNPGADNGQDFITMNRLTIKDGKRQGFLGGANNMVLTRSYFESNGRGNDRDHNIYLNRGSNMVISNNELYRSALLDGVCVGVSLVAHGNISDLLIEGNYIHEDIGFAGGGCWGIAVDIGGYRNPEGFTNITIRANNIVNVGNTAIGVSACDNCIIENNTIVAQQTFRTKAIRVPSKRANPRDLPLNNVTIRNNSITMTSFGTGITLGGEGSSHSVVGNTVAYTGTGNFTCIDTPLSPNSYSQIANNVCSDGAVTPPPVGCTP